MSSERAAVRRHESDGVRRCPSHWARLEVEAKSGPFRRCCVWVRLLRDGDKAMIEVTEPKLEAAARIVFAPLSKIRLIEPAHRR